MALTIETIREARWREGKRFIYLDNIVGLAAAATEDVLICVEANVESLTWEPFIGTQFTEGTGTELSAIPRNSAADSRPGAKITKAATITNDGQSLSGVPLNIVAQIFRNNNYYLNEDLISSDFVFMASTCYLIRLTNNSADATDVQLVIDISNS